MILFNYLKIIVIYNYINCLQMANNKNMINMNGTSDPFYRYLMPPIQIKIEGNNKMIKTIILNIQQIAICTKTSSDHIITFLGQELSVNYKYDKDINNRLLIFLILFLQYPKMSLLFLVYNVLL